MEGLDDGEIDTRTTDRFAQPRGVAPFKKRQKIMHLLLYPLKQVVGRGSSRDDHGCPRNDGYQTGHARFHRWYRIFVPIFNRLLRRQLEESGVQAGQYQENDLRSKESAEITFLSLGPEEKNAGYEHDDKADECQRHDLLVHLGNGLMLHSPTHQTKIEPH